MAVVMDVTAIIVTRGDVDLTEILLSLEAASPISEVLVWDNGAGAVRTYRGTKWGIVAHPVDDLLVYGRYAAIEYASGDLIYVQDDDVLHTTEGIQQIVEACVLQRVEHRVAGYGGAETMESVEVATDRVVCNMPANFRHGFYQEHALVGFGACFHRDAPQKAFDRFLDGRPFFPNDTGYGIDKFYFYRTCDIVFTALTPRVLVDVDYQDMPWASADNRMWKQSYHREERGQMLELVLEVRDG